MHLLTCGMSDAGRRRRNNEDSFCVRPDLGLFVIADGMGGHVGGEVASQVAVQAIADFIEATAGATADWPWPYGYDEETGLDGTRLRAALLLANNQIGYRAAQASELQGMATTVVAVLFDVRAAAEAPPHAAIPAIVGHVGDSRTYVCRAGRVEQITRDHSWVQEQVTAGTLSEGAARRHPWRNLVTRALAGKEDDPGVDLQAIEIRPGDRLLMCSDGLPAALEDRQIAELLKREAPGGDLQPICQAMIAAANEHGGPDNITVVVVEAAAACAQRGAGCACDEPAAR
jgi:PPM family protein phosphatase